MTPGRIRALSALLAVTFGLLACSRAPTKRVFQGYEGPPVFPERRAPLPAIAGELGLVSNVGSDTVSVVDVSAATVVATLTVGRNPVDLDGPHHVAVDRARGFAYVALSYPSPATTGPHAGHGASARLGVVQKLRLSDLRVVGEVRVDPNPGDIVLSDDGHRLVVTHFDLRKATAVDAGFEDRRASLALLDPDQILPTGSAAPVFVPVCAAPHGVALARPAGDRAYVACYGDDSITVVDLRTPSAPAQRIPLGAAARTAPDPPAYGPYSAALSPSGAELAVASLESKDVRVVDLTSMRVGDRAFPTVGAPYFSAWSADGGELFVPTQLPDAVRVLDARTGAVRRERVFVADECLRPHEAVLDAGGATVWIVCEGDHVKPGTVIALERATLATRRVLPVGVYPDRLVLQGAR